MILQHANKYVQTIDWTRHKRTFQTQDITSKESFHTKGEHLEGSNGTKVQSAEQHHNNRVS